VIVPPTPNVAAAPPTPTAPKSAPRVVDTPGWARLTGWKSYSWKGPTDDALKLVESIGRLQSYRYADFDIEHKMWQRKVSKLRLNFREDKLVQVTFRVSMTEGNRSALVDTLTGEHGVPTKDEDKDTRWVSEELEVRLIGANVTLIYVAMWNR
jgi:hypothetical protein